MAGKKQQPTMPIAQKVLEQPLDRVMHESMIPYAECSHHGSLPSQG